MNAKQINEAAQNAVDRTRKHHGEKLWEYVNPTTRQGWVAHSIVMDFASYAPDATARDIAHVVKAAHGIIAHGPVG